MFLLYKIISTSLLHVIMMNIAQPAKLYDYTITLNVMKILRKKR